MITNVYPAIKALFVIALWGVILSGCAFYSAEAPIQSSQTEPVAPLESSMPPALDVEREASSATEQDPEPPPTPADTSPEASEPVVAPPEMPQASSSEPEQPVSSLPEPPQELPEIESSSSQVAISEPPIIKNAQLQKGVPNGFATEPGEIISETTIHIEATIENPQYQRYNFILSLEDIAAPIVLGTYKSTKIPSQGSQVTLSVPMELSQEDYDLINNPQNPKITLTIVGIDKDEHTTPSAPLFLDADKTTFTIQN